MGEMEKAGVIFKSLSSVTELCCHALRTSLKQEQTGRGKLTVLTETT